MAAPGSLGVGAVIADRHGKWPVAYSGAHDGFWSVVGHDALKTIALDDQTFSSDFDMNNERKGYLGVGVPSVSIVPFGFLEMDNPEHAYIRRALIPRFSPTAIKQWCPVIQDLATAFVDDVLEKGESAFIDEIASPIPAVITMMMLGAPLTRWKAWAHANHLQNISEPGSEGKKQGEQEMGAMVGELIEIIAERRANPHGGEPKDMLDVMCHTEIGGRYLREEEIMWHCVLILAGGLDTTTSAMDCAVKWFAENPGERARLRAHPEKMNVAIEEFLRACSPVTGLARTATCPVEVEGQQMAEGDRLVMHFAAANYDPDVFDDPHTVDLERWPNKHFSFGHGVHRCIGLHLARATLEITLNEVLKRMPDYEIDHSRAKIYPDISINFGWIDLPMTFTAGSRVGSDFDVRNAEPELSKAAVAASAAVTELALAELDEFDDEEEPS